MRTVVTTVLTTMPLPMPPSHSLGGRVELRLRTALGSGRLGGSTRPSRAERPSITVTPLDFATVAAYDESTSRGRGRLTREGGTYHAHLCDAGQMDRRRDP